MITLSPMSAETWQLWRASSIEGYAADKVRVGTWPAEGAAARAASSLHSDLVMVKAPVGVALETPAELANANSSAPAPKVIYLVYADGKTPLHVHKGQKVDVRVELVVPTSAVTPPKCLSSPCETGCSAAKRSPRLQTWRPTTSQL